MSNENERYMREMAERAALIGGQAARGSMQGYGQYAQPASQPVACVDMVPVPQVTVIKHAQFLIPKTMTPRERKEFGEEFSEKVAKGFRVHAIQRTHRGLEVQLQRDERCTVPEFLDELDARLKEGA